MKITAGFVSNSSSSSFIIHIVSGEKCKHCGRSDDNFLSMMGKGYGGDDEDSITAEGKEAILAVLEEWWPSTYSKDVKALKEDMEACKDGKLYMVSLSNHHSLAESLRDGAFPNVTILKEMDC